MSAQEAAADQALGTLPNPTHVDSPPEVPNKGLISGALAGRSDRVLAWQNTTWTRASAVLGVVGILLCLLVFFTIYQMFAIVASDKHDTYFVFAGMTLLVGTLLRFLAILIGGGAVFAGLAVSFYTHANETQIEGDITATAKGKLATSSPGIAAIMVGAVVIIAALFAKGEYSYIPPVQIPLIYDSVIDKRPTEPPSTPASMPSALPTASSPLPSAVKSSAEIFQELKGRR